MRRYVILAAAILLGAFIVAGSSRYRPAAVCTTAIGSVCVVDGWTGKVTVRTTEGGQRGLAEALRDWREVGKDD